MRRPPVPCGTALCTLWREPSSLSPSTLALALPLSLLTVGTAGLEPLPLHPPVCIMHCSLVTWTTKTANSTKKGRGPSQPPLPQDPGCGVALAPADIRVHNLLIDYTKKNASPLEAVGLYEVRGRQK